VLYLLALATSRSFAEDHLNLPVIKPVLTCDALAKIDLSKAVGTPVTVQSTSIADTPAGQFCKVMGHIDPAIVFEVDLPLDRWTQRFEESPVNSMMIGNAGSCTPASNGEFAVAFDNQGHSGKGLTDASWTSNLEMRIDFAYRANHVTAVAAKALIKAFYGRPQQFSYFLGCSEGGREALTEAQRFPEDFDGVAAGSPIVIDSVHNIFFHPWEAAANKRADGSRVLTSSRLNILHNAVLLHCAASSGVLDGVLLEPTACKFNPSWVQCPGGTTDTSACLTAEEVAVIEKLYQGPGDNAGHRFEISGFPMGTELRWPLSTTDHIGDRESKEGFQIRRLLPPPEGDEDTSALEDTFTFSQDWFNKTLVLAPLYNAGNTNLRPFQEHGGKLILWNGAEDMTIQPEISVAYYQGVQKELGMKVTDTFMRLFLIPGFGHCGGGDIPFQLDLLTPLMAWTELHRAPAMIIAGKAVDNPNDKSQGGPRGPASPGGPWAERFPFAMRNQANQYTRPVYPFPYIARYKGHGDPNNAENYEPVKSAAPSPQAFDTQVTQLIGPGTQKFYHVQRGQLLPDTQSGIKPRH
jgi:feruloyl esterase